jgi:LysM repeat protein
MKKIFFTLLIILGMNMILFAQEDVNILISKNFETVNGQKFYLHKVEKGQTLYSISKIYQVDIKTLEADTHNLNLKIGQILYIPYKQENQAKNIAVYDTVSKTHIVLSKETLYGISKKYNVDEEDLISLNPELKNGLKIGMSIIIPSQNNLKSLDKSQISKIKEIDKIVKPEEKKVFKQKKDDTFNVALLIPLYLSSCKEINIENLQIERKTADNFKSFKYIQFYEGFLMVADSLSKLGLKIKVYTFDVPEDSAINLNFLKKNELAKMDLIIGPFFYKAFKQVAEFAKSQDIPIVNPFSERRNIIDNFPNVFKLIPSYQYQADCIAKYLVDSFPNANILLIHNNKDLEKKRAEVIKKSVSEVFKQNITSEGSIKDVIYSQVGFAGLQSKLSINRANILFALIENEIFVTGFVSKLRNMSDQNLTLIAPIRWKLYDKIESEYFLNLNTHFFEPSFVDYQDEAVKSFVLSFRDKFIVEPNEMAFAGHDIALYFLTALSKYGSDFKNNLKNISVKTLQTDYKFEKPTENSGFENAFVNIYQMLDYKYVGKNK